MSEMVHVGQENLVGEVIALSKDRTTVQVFEETTGLKPGAEVTGTGDAISVTLGPGILNNIFDGIQRPLSEIAARSGKYITRGVSVDSLDTEKKWKGSSDGSARRSGPGRNHHRGNPGNRFYPAQIHGASGSERSGDPGGSRWRIPILDPIVTLRLEDGSEKELTLCQKWPHPDSPAHGQAVSRFDSPGSQDSGS